MLKKLDYYWYATKYYLQGDSWRLAKQMAWIIVYGGWR